MQRSTERILTTHTGSLPRPPAILEAMRTREAGGPFDQTTFERDLQREVQAIVRDQALAGIDVVNDGECGKPSFNAYVRERLDGFQVRVPSGGVAAPTGPFNANGRDEREFADYYAYVKRNNPFIETIRVAPRVCVGPIEYSGHAALQRDISNLRQALSAAPTVEGFLPSSSPIPTLPNEFYASDEEYALAYGEAMREEYKGILDAGFVLQIDDPRMVSDWDAHPDMSLDEYRKLAFKRVEIINHALRDLPHERIRYHTCYGINFGPRVSDLQLADVVDILLSIDAGAYSFEAANPRHEHEFRVFADVQLPADKVLVPGVITHSNVTIEHPQVIADRIVRWAQVVGRERVIAGNDCGFASTAGNLEIPMTVAWAKLRALGEGARLASQELWSAGQVRNSPAGSSHSKQADAH